jgi:putative transposase
MNKIIKDINARNNNKTINNNDTSNSSATNNSTQFKAELLDEILKDYNHENPEELIGNNGLLKKLKKAIVERALEGEMTHHLGYSKSLKIDRRDNEFNNYRNGHSSKRLITEDGDINIDVPRDRESSFEPQIVSKRQNRFTGFDDKIISMYSRGMSVMEIQGHLLDIYGTEVSKDFISNVTDSVLEEVESWQNRSLDSIYPIVYMDAIRIKGNEEGRIINKAIYIAIGVNMNGKKEVLGLWIDKNEGAKFWLKVVTELKNRGVNDIFIACVDGLKGFPEAINSVFPNTQVQLCIVHMVRNSLKFVSYKDRKAVAKDLKSIYTSINREQAEKELDEFRKKWDNKYSTIADSWQRNWNEVTPFFEYPDFIRKAIYTTNAIESINCSIRKVTKNRCVFPNDKAIIKIIYLSLKNIEKRWTMPIRDWKLALSQFAILFADRFPERLGEF